MLDNHLYNLLNQLVQEHKSLWRINQNYKNDAGDCADCTGLWDKLAKQKEENIEEIWKIVQGHSS
ncbi:hypothetical protein IH979_00485 [Patescibacteria group bacterium]|nr:hypothetical protein [Patescibacteria group bacterium]